MARRTLDAWIFDAYPEPGGMRVWFVDPDGRHFDALDPWRPVFHLSGTPSQLDAVRSLLRRQSFPTAARWTERQELFSGRSVRVLEVECPAVERDALVRRLDGLRVGLYDADVHIVQTYHYDRGHFPLARGRAAVEGGVLAAFELDDDPWAVDYPLPPLRTMGLSLSGSDVAGRTDPNHGLRGRLVLTMEGRAHELEGSVREQLVTLARRLREWDPDVIESEWGDSVLMPLLDRLAREERVPLPFSRDPGRGMAGRGERSFYTYGRAVYQGGARYLFGRWHLDRRNSFMLRETGRDGLFEIARIAKIPVQRAGRCTIGTSLSSMQTAWAWKQGVLIPMAKQQAEDFRPASALLAADKGGLVFAPDVGWHDHVAEFDFTSMYPEMMVRHNISPETVNCPCCPDNEVPEIGHHLCTKRRGLVPSVLAPILEKRAHYKRLYKSGAPGAKVYKARADAHKWCLVCCFGYLGFKNARFGKIEAHECVTAWGREVLLRAKEAVERRGYRLLHALVDALWIEAAPDADLEELRAAVEAEAGCPLALEGFYKWIRYCPSKQDALLGVPGRYFGAFDTGELKIRGLACRRHDTPRLFKDLQTKLLERLARAGDLAGRRAAVPELLEIVEDFRLRLKESRVGAEDLAITFYLSQTPDEYVHDTQQAVAARKLAAAGVELHVGEAVRYVITNAKDKVKDWRAQPLSLMEGGLEYDTARYLELLERAAWEILDGLAPAPRPAKTNRPAKSGRNLQLPLVFDAASPTVGLASERRNGAI
jgi:DNA polymerase elongation subunit (family B)